MSKVRKALARHPGGRPPKFGEPSRPVTVTLPERTLSQLARIHNDRARAIVKATDALTSAGSRGNPVEVVEVAEGIGLIVVGPSRALRAIPWLKMFEIAPARYILSIPAGTPVDSLEVALHDIVETRGILDEEDRLMVEQLLKRIRGLRRRQEVSRSEILLVDTSSGNF